MNQRWFAFSRFVLGLIAIAAAHFLAGGFGSQDMFLLRGDVVYRPMLLLFLLAGFSIVVSGFDGVRGNPLAAIGLAMRRPWLRDLWVGGLLGAGMVTVAVALIAVMGNLAITVSVSRVAIARAVLALFILVCAAVAEEVSFRGYPLQRLVQAIGPAPAVLVLSLLFGAVHLRNPHAAAWGYTNTVLIGVLLSVACLRTQSLWMPIAIHFWWNTTLGLIFGLPVSGLREFSVITRSHTGGPLWLTGGSYGLEASALGAMVIVTGIAGLAVFLPARAPGFALSAPGAPGPPAIPGGFAGDGRGLPEPALGPAATEASLPKLDAEAQPDGKSFSGP